MRAVLSVVIPLYNEAENIPRLFQVLNQLVNKLPKRTELIFVDDGSKDETLKLLRQKKIKYPKMIIELSRNFGHQAALLAGLEQATGQYIVTMDGDLQHPPSLIPEMLRAHKEGIDIVLTRRIDTTNTPFFKRATAALFYFFINFLSDTTISVNASDFRSMNRAAVTALLQLPEKRKFLRGMVEWIGFRTLTLPFVVGERHHGQSKYNVLKMSRLAFYAVTSFSTLPLYLSGFFSVVLFILAGMYGMYVLYVRIVIGIAVTGWASVLLVLLIVGAVTSLSLGLIGVYLEDIYDEVKRRPSYVIRQTYDSTH